ncbi:unnamed protein product [Euphydryas editha]|uniref:THAP-type domain-containing protein n=1 Tax=Euphydryas editha TaxID=104508 RepID=A0AAU9TFE0_EUPED|nr:unnamed protein product [Euphydryas editha]
MTKTTLKCEICNRKTCRVDNKKRDFMAKFPLDRERCKKWVKATGKEDLAYVPIEKLHQLKYICAKHFRNKDFNKKKTRLKKTAIPSLDISSTPLSDDILVEFPLSCVASSQLLPVRRTDNLQLSCRATLVSQGRDIQAVPMTPRKRKLIKKLKYSQTLIKNLKKKVDKIDNIESPTLKSLIASSISNQRRKNKGKRWTKFNKTVAVAIYKKSPKAYRYLSQLLPMPSIRTLQTVLDNMKMNTGIDPMSMNHLKKKSESLSDKDKTCVILFDEIALKKRLIYNITTDKIDGYEDLGDGKRSEKIADHALVIMLQGVHKSMKQPIAHYFVKGTIATEKLAIIIKDVIRAITEAGYEVIATVCDQGPTNMGALNLLKTWGHSTEPHYFFLDGKKVFIIYDVPHLFKSIRNNFLQAGEMIMDNKKGKWTHLIKLEEKNSSTLHFKKISKLHVNPKFRTKMKVKLAAQILSNTVAAILKLQAESVENQGERQEILQTAYIVEDLDQLFDCTNGPASRSDIKRNIRQNVSKNSFHHKRWIEFKMKLKTLHFLKSDSQLRLRNITCVNGYIITLSSLQDIWSYLNTVKNLKYMNLRQFNQDALENLFGQIRQHSPTNRNPTCHHFTSALKSAILTRLSAPLSKGSNCQEDYNEIIVDFQDIVFPKKNYHPVKHTENATEADSYHVEVDDFQDVPILHIVENTEQQNYLVDIEKKFKKFEKQPTVYVSGYLASVLLKGVECLKCINALRVSNPQTNMYNYIALREWWTDKTSLTYPTLQLCKAIDDATHLFDTRIKPHIFYENIRNYFKTEILTHLDISWMCNVHKNVMIDKLLERVSLLLIRNHCKQNNRSFALSEEASADAVKKAQQQGFAK